MAITDHPNYAVFEVERISIFQRLESKQKERDSNNKKRLQCILTPTTDADGSTLQEFDESRHADHEIEGWEAMNVNNFVKDGVFLQYYVHRYDGAGVGCILGARLIYDSLVWCYEEHYGPEDRIGPFNEWYNLQTEELF